jgi:NAD-dependent SIR2 family protein deacetylase
MGGGEMSEIELFNHNGITAISYDDHAVLVREYQAQIDAKDKTVAGQEASIKEMHGEIDDYKIISDGLNLRVDELLAQIERMKNCENCETQSCSDWVSRKVCDKWEAER